MDDIISPKVHTTTAIDSSSQHGNGGDYKINTSGSVDTSPDTTKTPDGAQQENVNEPSSQGTFDVISNIYMSGFITACESQANVTGISIVDDPRAKNPIIYIHGNELDAAKLLKRTLDMLKQNIINQLT